MSCGSPEHAQGEILGYRVMSVVRVASEGSEMSSRQHFLAYTPEETVLIRST